MKILERILVPTDFSHAAKDAVRTAIFVAKKFSSEICLLHVIPGTLNFSSDVRAMVEKKVGEHLRKTVEQIRAEGIQSVEAVIENGVPADQIDQHAMRGDVNVIIMGAGELGNGKPFRLGTVTARIRSQATKPVWAVKPGVLPRFSKILCPVDCSESSGRALKNAIHLAREFPAELTVLAVNQGLPDYYEPFGKAAAVEVEPFTEEPLPQLDPFLAHSDFHNVCLNKVIRHGDPVRQIVTTAHETKADLLVMGSVGKTGFSKLWIGGVTRKVAQEMPCSIVTVKSEHAVRLRLDAEADGIKAHFKQGQELLEHGFPEEAMSQFQHCIALNSMHAPAWEGMAAAHRRMAHLKETSKCTEKAMSIVQQIEDIRLETEIRSHHPLLGRKRHYL